MSSDVGRAHAEVRRAVFDLVEPVEFVSPDGAATGVNDSLIVQLGNAVHEGLGGYGGRRAANPVPICVAATDLLREVERQWRMPGMSLLESLRAYPAFVSPSGDVDALRLAAEGLRNLAQSIRDLLSPPIRIHLGVDCPECGNGTAYRLSGGEWVRGPALSVSLAGGECLACGAGWSTESLASILG